ncbi:MAG: hypothetical protein AAGK17_04310 [Pseudomonadota bacterium]
MGIEYIGVMIPIIAIVMGCSIGLLGVWTKHQQKLAQINGDKMADATAEKAAQYAAQVSKLEDRVQVLERIVTDRGYDVATQIEALRDIKEVEESGSGVPLNINTQEKA